MIRLLKDYPLYQLRVALKGSQPAIWRWIGGHFDPEAFDFEAVNRRLSRLR